MNGIAIKYNWKKIRFDYEAHSLSYKELSKKYGPHTRTIERRKKKEGWVKGSLSDTVDKRSKKATIIKLSKDAAQVNKESDDILDLAAKKIMENLSEGRVGFQSLSFAVSSMKIIREERMDMRGELNTLENEKFKLAREKLEKDKSPGGKEDTSPVVFGGEEGLC